jgi:inorganic pyrophosphatase
MLDDGHIDDKIIAVPFTDPNYNNYHDIDELPAHIFDEIMHFFKVYKQLENKQTDIKELYNREEAEKIVREAIDGYVEKFCRG